MSKESWKANSTEEGLWSRLESESHKRSERKPEQGRCHHFGNSALDPEHLSQVIRKNTMAKEEGFETEGQKGFASGRRTDPTDHQRHMD